jgi:hypothetical protein
MATITLTDRISVRVTAKDSTDTSNQNTTNGGNVASALGGSGLTDSEKEELGESLGETVTDENGRTYARSDKVAGVLKKLSQDGKLTPTYDGIDGYCFNNVFIGQTVRIETNFRDPAGVLSTINEITPSSGNVYVSAYYAGSGYGTGFMFYSKESFSVDSLLTNYNTSGAVTSNKSNHYTAESRSVTINNESYSFFVCSSFFNMPSESVTRSVSPNIDRNNVDDLSSSSSLKNKYAAGTLFGGTSGGAIVDPTGKTDAQIQKDLEDFAALNGCKMTSESGNSYIAVTDANGDPLYFLGT